MLREFINDLCVSKLEVEIRGRERFYKGDIGIYYKMSENNDELVKIGEKKFIGEFPELVFELENSLRECGVDLKYKTSH